MNPISQIKLERKDKRMKLTLPYNPTYIKKIKTIPGYYWHPDKKYCLPAASLRQAGSFPYSEDILNMTYTHVLNKGGTGVRSPVDII